MGILSGKMYVANLRDNVNRGMNYNWSIGKYQTKAPVGYLNVNKDIIVDSERAPLVKKMFEMYATPKFCLERIENIKNMKIQIPQNIYLSYPSAVKISRIFSIDIINS